MQGAWCGTHPTPPQDWQISHIREIGRSIGRLFENKKYVYIPHINEKMVAFANIVQCYKNMPLCRKHVIIWIIWTTFQSRSVKLKSSLIKKSECTCWYPMFLERQQVKTQY